MFGKRLYAWKTIPMSRRLGVMRVMSLPSTTIEPESGRSKPATSRSAVVYSSHILEVVERVCERVAIIHRGRVVADGAPSALIESHPGATLAEIFLGLTSSR